jgi:antitoxin PrlF
MAIAQSRVTAQGQVSVPADVRKALGIGPGSILEWEQEDGKVVVRRAGKYTFDGIHRALFGDKKVKKRSLRELKEGIRSYIRERHARR